MKHIVIYRHPDCAKCARYARTHHALDWLNRIATVTVTPPAGPLRHAIAREINAGEDEHCQASAAVASPR